MKELDNLTITELVAFAHGLQIQLESRLAMLHTKDGRAEAVLISQRLIQIIKKLDEAG